MIVYGIEINKRQQDIMQLTMMRNKQFTLKTIEDAAVEIGIPRQTGDKNYEYKYPAYRAANRMLEKFAKQKKIKQVKRGLWKWCS